MKRNLLYKAAATAAFLAVMTGGAAAAEGPAPAPVQAVVISARLVPATILVNGQPARFDQAPYLQDGALMLPLRALVEAAGGTIAWNQETKSADIKLADRTATVTVGAEKAEMYLNNARYFTRNFLPMERAAALTGGRIFISQDAAVAVLGLEAAASPDGNTLAFRYGAAVTDLTFELQWFENRLQISGKAAVPDVSFQLLQDGAVIAQADATVKEGEYIANLLVEKTGKFELRILDPRTGAVLATARTAR